MDTNDNKINELLDRAKNYRNELSKSSNEFGNFENLITEELQEIFQKGRNEFKIEDKRNVFVQCRITEDEVKKGPMKKIKYKRINENGNKETNEILIKIPEGINVGQSIVIYGEGNYVKELDKSSDLIVEIKF